MENIGFTAHAFVIIDLVPCNELETAKQIEEGLGDAIIAENSGLFCYRYKCKTTDDLFKVFSETKRRLEEEGETPYIHIEGHGSKEGVKFPDGSVLPWSKIFEHFREINILCKNNLFFSSGACHSAYAFKTVTINEPTPVFGMLAPVKEVKAGGVLDGYIAFYKSLIRNESLSDAFKALAHVTDGKQYALIVSQLFFEKAACKYIKQHCLGKGRKERLEYLVTQTVKLSGRPVKRARKPLKESLRKPQAKYLDKIHKKFMMIDKYTENSKRFKFDAVNLELRVRSGELKNI